MIRLITFPNFTTTTFWQSHRFCFSNPTQIFSKESYLNSAKDDVMQLMCKFEANWCGFRVAENQPLGTLSFRQQCINHFRSSNSTQIFSKESYTWIQQKIILCSSCVNLKQIGVFFVMLKIDLSELCHPDNCKSLSFLKLDTDFFSNKFILLYWI